MVSAHWWEPSGLDGDIVVFCSCGSCTFTAASCISSFCAFVCDSSFLEGITCFLDGAIVVGIVAHVLEGVYWICCCSSSGKGLVSHSSSSAFDCDFPTFVGVSESACDLSILNLGGLWFLAGPSQKAKEFVSKELSKFISSGILFRH